MSEVEQQRAYVYNRVLIESERVLDPQAPGKSVFLTAAHLEILRNLAAYAHRKETFVKEYQAENYLVPTDIEWDQISSFVAEMEYNLMGADNILWGFNTPWKDAIGITMSGDGTFSEDTTPVPEGWVYVAQAMTLRNSTAERGIATIRVIAPTATISLAYATTLPVREPLVHSDELALSEGDYVRFVMTSCLASDVLEATVWGYKVKLPE